MIELAAGELRCIVSPQDGGRIAALRVAGAPMLVERDASASPMSWGSYPMVPFAGRVRDGRFTFAGHERQLPINLPPHAIHGYGYTSAWSVTDLGERFIEMRLELPDPWPFGGAVTQRIEVDERSLRCTLIVTADEQSMPAQVGWHPWFRKPASVDLRFAHMYHRDTAGIPDGTLVDQPAGPWDDCFVEPLAPLRLRHDGGPTLTIDSDCDHWVVYDEQSGATCVEPQSGPPDAFNSAAVVLQHGEHLTRWMRIGVEM